MAANILPITMFFLKDGRTLLLMLREPRAINRQQRHHPESGFFVHFDPASMNPKGDGTVGGSTFSRVSSLRRRSSGSTFYVQTAVSPQQGGWHHHQPPSVEVDGQQRRVELDGFEHVELDTGSGTVICKVMPGETLLLSPQGRDK